MKKLHQGGRIADWWEQRQAGKFVHDGMKDKLIRKRPSKDDIDLDTPIQWFYLYALWYGSYDHASSPLFFPTLSQWIDQLFYSIMPFKSHPKSYIPGLLMGS